MNDDTPRETGRFDTTRQLCWIRFGAGTLLFGGGYDGRVRRWDYEGIAGTDKKPAELAPIEGFRGWVQAFARHPSGASIFVADSWGRIACCDAASKQPVVKWAVDEAHDGWIRSLSLSADGRRLASAGNDGHVRVFDTTNGKRLHEWPVGDEDVFAVAMNPDGTAVVTGDLFCRLHLRDLATGKVTRTFDAGTLHYYDRDQDVCGLRVLQFQDDGRSLIAAGAEPTSAGRGHGVPVVYVFDVETGKRTKRLEQGDKNDGFVADLVHHPDGYLITVTTGQPGRGKLLFHRPQEEQPFVVHTKGIANTHSAALHPDGRTLVVAATNRSSQGNGAVKDKEGRYLGNYSPLHLFTLGDA